MISPPRTLPVPRLGSSPQDCHRPSDASSDLALAVAFARSASQGPFVPGADLATIGDSIQGGPLLLYSGIAFKGSPLQVNEAQGLPLSQRMGFASRGVPFSKANGIRLLRVPSYPGGSLLQME